MADQNNGPIQITISGVLNLLNTGNDRDAIAAHYGISKADCKALFQHPSLKGKKVKKVKVPAFVIVDDTETSGTPTAPCSAHDSEAEAYNENQEGADEAPELPFNGLLTSDQAGEAEEMMDEEAQHIMDAEALEESNAHEAAEADMATGEKRSSWDN